jgi:DNA invertase Pin-like site-specific DNA recombinase
MQKSKKIIQSVVHRAGHGIEPDFRFVGAFSEFERSTVRQRVKLGLKRALAQGKRLGRPPIDGKTEPRGSGNCDIADNDYGAQT